MNQPAAVTREGQPSRTSSDLSNILEQLNVWELSEAKKLADTLSVEDSNAVTQFGTEVQQDIAEFAGAILAQVRSSESGEIGAAITELILTIEQVPQEQATATSRALNSIPLVSKWLGSAKRTLKQTHSLDSQVEAIRSKLDEAYIMLQKDNELLDLVMKKNYAYFKKLDLHIAAAQLRLQELEQQERPHWLTKIEQGIDPWAEQKLSELDAFHHRLEIRLDDFKRTRFLSLTQAPRIRMLQQSGQLMMEKIQSVIYNLVPLWKLDLVAGLAQARAGRALEVHNQVQSHIETSMQESAELTRRVAVDIAKQSEAGMIGMDTLRSVHEQLLATLDETMSIYSEGRQKRQETEQELIRLERELKHRLAQALGG